MKTLVSVSGFSQPTCQERSEAYGFAMAAALWSMIIAASLVC